jgi:hypothetical protein
VAEAESAEHQRSKEEREAAEAAPAEAAAPAEVLRWGSGAAEITAVRLLDEAGAERYHFASGEAVTIEIRAVAREPLSDFVFGVAIATPRGVECWGTNTDLEGYEPGSFSGPATVRVRCPALRLGAGEYLLDVAVHARSGSPYDYRRKLVAFTITTPRAGVGVYAPEREWRFAGEVVWRRRPEP